MKQLLSGNEAIALGAYHAGLAVAAAYPGTPSTEILEAITHLEDVYAEWSPNEKVAFDVALGAAWSGRRALVTMKHVGLNVAADPFFSASYSGVVAGLVVVTADDPGMHSSQNEQDNRHYARAAKVPLLEPADSQECYDFMRLAFELSERFNTPVLLRTTTRVAHSRTVVDVTGERPELPEAKFHHDPARFVLVPGNAKRLHPKVEARQRELAAYASASEVNRMEPGLAPRDAEERNRGDGRLGIITSGVAYQYAREVFPDAAILKLGLSYPLPEQLIRSFAASVERLIVVEELDPVLEQEVRALGLAAEGKSIFPILGEFDLEVVAAAARRAGLLDGQAEELPAVPEVPLPARPPVLCPGCPHRSTFYVLSLLGRRQRRPDGSAQEPRLVISGDIGCYTLGVLPPLNALDTTVSMGSSIGIALGACKAGVQDKVLAVIGDSTFMHSGIPALVDVVYNGGDLTVLVLDNGTTAMTGHQDNPTTGRSALGQEAPVVSIAAVARAVGVADVREANAFDLPALRRELREAMDYQGPSVVVVQGLCALRNKEPRRVSTVNADKCNDCGLCLRLGCPAIVKGKGTVTIDENLCVGSVCHSMCGQVCAHGAISLSGV